MAKLGEGPPEVLEPRQHLLGILPIQHPHQVVDNLSWVVVGDLGRPPCPNAVGTVDQDHGQDWNVPEGK